MIHVIVDTRESTLYPILVGLLTSSDGITLKQEMLEIGDVLITLSEGDDTKNIMLFERKTMADLASSIKDGRYKEQKQRMMAIFPPHRISYIIEGGHIIQNSADGGLSKSVYMGMYANTMYRDGIHVIHVRNTGETAAWIAEIAGKLVSKPNVFDGSGGATTYLESCKTKSRKQDNIDTSSCYRMQLSQIPGISHKLANNIANVYPSMFALFQAISPISKQDAIGLLSKIPLIGKKKAVVIVDYLKPTTDV